MSDEPTDTQKTQPKKGDPVDIPIPSEDQVERDFTKIATATHSDPEETQPSDTASR